MNTPLIRGLSGTEFWVGMAALVILIVMMAGIWAISDLLSKALYKLISKRRKMNR